LVFTLLRFPTDASIGRCTKQLFQYPIISLETRFNDYINNVPINGAMDRVVEYDKDHICVVDYKTSKTPFTKDELRNDIQAGLYDLVTAKNYPDKNILVCFDYLRKNLPLRVTLSDEKRKQNILLIETVYEDIKRSEKKDLKPNPNDFCAWCEYATVCPEMEEAKKRLNSTDIDSLQDIDEIASLYNDAKRMSAFYNNNKKRLSSLLIERLRKDRNNHINTGVFKITQRQNAYVKYLPEDVYRLIGADNLIKCVDIKKDKFESEAIKRGVSRDELDSIRIINMSNPILTVKTI
jgi:hypothetical protein